MGSNQSDNIQHNNNQSDNNRPENLISIIVPVYNVCDYLDECVASLVNQTYNNLEIILVDDGSSDGSETKCDEWVKKDDRILVIHTENAGVSAARNTGLEIAKGDYITYADPDDAVHPQCCETALKAMLEHKPDIVMFNANNIEEEETPTFEALGDYTVTFVENENPIRILAKPNLPIILFGVVWNKLYRRDIAKCGSFPLNMKIQDRWYNTDVFLNAKKLVAIDAKLYYYRKRAASALHSPEMVDKIAANLISVLDHEFSEISQKCDKTLFGSIFCLDLSRIARKAVSSKLVGRNNAEKMYREAFVKFYDTYKWALKKDKTGVLMFLARFFPRLYYAVVKKSVLENEVKYL